MMKNNYLLTESLFGSVSVYMILKKLMMDFKDWDAYKLGIIDHEGNKLKHPVTGKERESWDILTRFCWNIKKLSMKFIGKTKFAQYFTAAYLLKDSISMFYISKNQIKLNETILSDITYSKQLYIENIIKQLPIVSNVNEENLELMIFKYLQEVEKVLEVNKDIITFFEDEGIATTVNDMAKGPGQYLGVTKKNAIDPFKFVKKDLSKIIKPKKKRKKKNESN